MRHPDALEFAILSLAAFRLVRLVGWDTITTPLREWLCGLSEREGYQYVGRRKARPGLQEWIHCPWCMGFWVCLAVWAAWLAWPRATVGASVPLAIAAVVGLVAKNLDE